MKMFCKCLLGKYFNSHSKKHFTSYVNYLFHFLIFIYYWQLNKSGKLLMTYTML